MPKTTIEVAVNERGRRIGQSHPRAKLTDHEVDLLREVYEELLKKHPRRAVAAMVAEKFEIHPRSVDKIYYCERRGQTAAKAKRVAIA